MDAHDHGSWTDSAAAYVLGALPDDERRGYESHLATCAVCRDEVDGLQSTSDALAVAVDPVMAPADLRSRLMEVVEQEARLLRAAGPEADRPARQPRAARRLRWASLLPLRPAFALPAVLLILAGVMGGVMAAGGLRGAEPETAEIRSLPATVSERVAPNAVATLEWEGMNATLVAERLPKPPDGRVYQVWVKRPHVDPEPTSTLFMPARDGSAAAAVPGPLEGMEAVIVSHEPPGGSPAPTSGPVLSVQLGS